MSVRLIFDTGEAITLNDPTEGLVNTSIEVGTPAIRGVATDRFGQDGSDDHTRHVGARAITVTIDLRERPHTRQALIDGLAPLMHPRNRLWLEHAAVPGQAPRRIRVRPDDAPLAWDNPRSLVIPWAFRTVGLPYWLGEERTVDLAPDGPGPGFTFPLTFDLTFPDAPSSIAHAYNAGSEDAEWVATIVGPARRPVLRRIDSGQAVALRLELLDGQVAVVDSYARTVTVDGQTHYGAVDQAATSWWRVPARTSVPVSMAVAGAAGVGSLTYADTYFA